jgi:hypothetical protein
MKSPGLSSYHSLLRRNGGNQMKVTYAIICLLFCLVSLAQDTTDHEEFVFVRRQIKGTHSFTPKNGYVPDKETAVAIAYAVAIPVYGKDQVESEKPFRAELESEKWTVLGTLDKRWTSGGTVIVQIDKATGQIVYLNHSK